MVKFYTALGRYEIRRNGEGKQYPVVILNGKTHAVDIQEMIIWSSLIWQICTYDEIYSIYAFKMNEAQTICMAEFGDCLDRLEQRGIVVSCSDYVGVNALYGLFRGLFVVPVEEPFITKVFAFLHLIFKKKVPFKETKKIFVHDKLSGVEKTVMQAIRKSMLTTSELVQYITAADMIPNGKVYKNKMSESGSTIIFNQLSAERQPVLQTVVDLYLKKLILFESVKDG